MEIRELRERLYERMNPDQELSDEELQELIEVELDEAARNSRIGLNERERMAEELFDSLRKLDILQQLVDDDEITEIMINGKDHIFYEKAGEASVTICTSETQPYGCIILKKGVK